MQGSAFARRLMSELVIATSLAGACLRAGDWVRLSLNGRSAGLRDSGTRLHAWRKRELEPWAGLCKVARSPGLEIDVSESRHLILMQKLLAAERTVSDTR